MGQLLASVALDSPLKRALRSERDSLRGSERDRFGYALPPLNGGVLFSLAWSPPHPTRRRNTTSNRSIVSGKGASNNNRSPTIGCWMWAQCTRCRRELAQQRAAGLVRLCLSLCGVFFFRSGSGELALAAALGADQQEWERINSRLARSLPGLARLLERPSPFAVPELDQPRA